MGRLTEDELISKAELYQKLAELEDLARERVLDTPTNSPVYRQYVCQLNERTAIKHIIADCKAVNAVPVKRGKWILHGNGDATCNQCGRHQKAIWDYDNWQNYCGNCGAEMIGVENERD